MDHSTDKKGEQWYVGVVLITGLTTTCPCVKPNGWDFVVVSFLDPLLIPTSDWNIWSSGMYSQAPTFPLWIWGRDPLFVRTDFEAVGKMDIPKWRSAPRLFIFDIFETVGALHLEARFRHLYTFMIGLKFCHDKIDVKVKECPKAFYIWYVRSPCGTASWNGVQTCTCLGYTPSLVRKHVLKFCHMNVKWNGSKQWPKHMFSRYFGRFWGPFFWRHHSMFILLEEAGTPPP